MRVLILITLLTGCASNEYRKPIEPIEPICFKFHHEDGQVYIFEKECD